MDLLAEVSPEDERLQGLRSEQTRRVYRQDVADFLGTLNVGLLFRLRWFRHLVGDLSPTAHEPFERAGPPSSPEKDKNANTA